MEACRNVALTSLTAQGPRETSLHFPASVDVRYPETHRPGAGSFQEEPQSVIGDTELGHLALHALGHNRKTGLGRVD